MMGGKKAKQMKNKRPAKTYTIFPEEDQFFGIVEKFHSPQSIFIHYLDVDKIKLGRGILRGKLIKRIKKCSKGDVLIFTKREFEGEKEMATLDIIHKYHDDEISDIISQIPDELRHLLSINTTGNNENNDDEIDIVFSNNINHNEFNNYELENEDLNIEDI